MSLINQVLKDLDSRVPFEGKPEALQADGVVATPENTAVAAVDWPRILVWGSVALIVVAVAVYGLWFVDEPEAPVFEPVKAVPVAKPALPSSDVKAAPPTTVVSTSSEDSVKPAEVAVETVPAATVTSSPKTATVGESETIDYLPLLERKTPGEREPKPDNPKSSVTATAIKESADRESVSVTRKPLKVAHRKKLSVVQKSRQLIRQGHLLEAEKRLTTALQQDPANSPLRELLIGLMLRSHRDTEAMKLVNEGLESSPYRENLVLLKARALVKARQQEQAVDLLQQLVIHKTAGQKTLSLLASLYQQLGDYDASVAMYRQLVSTFSVDAPVWLGYAVSLEATGKSSAALAAFRNALSMGRLSYALQKYARQRIDALHAAGNRPHE